ncbi:MAG: methionyl-tRNA formyltransferase [Treponema sp.]|jgi:methionyl-tRNA formyltransferase|nr:methionyl-tRNA formyltransferase [Treponema sp.]
MRILFAASPAIAVPALEAVLETDDVDVAGVLTNPDTPRGRNGLAAPTDVGAAAAGFVRKSAETGGKNFPVLKPLILDSAVRRQIAPLKADLLVSFAYGKIFGSKFLSLFPAGGINIHPSLLPKYRGPTPVQAAILNREKNTGITIQKLAREMDSGDILAQETVRLTGRETTAVLSELMAKKAAFMLPAVIREIAAGKITGTVQNHNDATYCHLTKREDGLIDWNKSAVQIDARIRAFDPWPLSWTIHNNRELFILEAEALACEKSGKAGLVLGTDNGILLQTGEGILAVRKLQYQTKKALVWSDFLNGARDFIGSKLG